MEPDREAHPADGALKKDDVMPPINAAQIQPLSYGNAFPGLQHHPRPPVPPAGQAMPLPPPLPPGTASDRITIYAPYLEPRTGRWTGRATLRTRGEVVELTMTGSDRLYKAARGVVNSLSHWLRQHVEYQPAGASFQGFGHIPGTAGRRFGQRASSILGAQPGIEIDASDPAEGLFAAMPIVATQLIRADLVPIDEEVSVAIDKVRGAYAGDPESIRSIATMREHAAAGSDDARAAIETVELVDVALSRPESIEISRVMHDANCGNPCARKTLAALREVAERCPTRIEWCAEDYAQRAEDELVKDVICAVTDHIEARCASACYRGGAGRSGSSLRRATPAPLTPPRSMTLAEGVASFGCCNFGATRQVRPNYDRAMLETYYAMLGGTLA